MKRKSPVVVNLFGPPGAGKSTGAAYVFSKLKMAGVNAELVTEYAKDKVWEGNTEVFKPENQCYIFSKQYFRMNRCSDKVEVIITDSPLPLSILYNNSEVLGENFNTLVMNCFNSYNNLSYLLTRAKAYNPSGRFQTEEESDKLALVLQDLLIKRNIQFEKLPGNTVYYDKIVENVLSVLKKEKDS